MQSSINDYLLQQISGLLVREVPGLVDTLDIRQVVARKVDSLDLLRLEGLLMGTRSGDIDPAIVAYLMEKKHLDTKQITNLLNNIEIKLSNTVQIRIRKITD